VQEFLQTLLDVSAPMDMDFPKDKALADGGQRKKNIDCASIICTKMISVKKC
jgi:hypothetical protein